MTTACLTTCPANLLCVIKIGSYWFYSKCHSIHRDWCLLWFFCWPYHLPECVTRPISFDITEISFYITDGSSESTPLLLYPGCMLKHYILYSIWHHSNWLWSSCDTQIRISFQCWRLQTWRYTCAQQRCQFKLCFQMLSILETMTTTPVVAFDDHGAAIYHYQSSRYPSAPATSSIAVVYSCYYHWYSSYYHSHSYTYDCHSLRQHFRTKRHICCGPSFNCRIQCRSCFSFIW